MSVFYGVVIARFIFIGCVEQPQGGQMTPLVNITKKIGGTGQSGGKIMVNIPLHTLRGRKFRKTGGANDPAGGQQRGGRYAIVPFLKDTYMLG